MKRFGSMGAVGILALALGALALGLAACGEEHPSEVVEGEPIELGALSLNVQLTRFLNPADREDSEYLEGLPPPPLDHSYLGVFIEAENDGDDDAALPRAEQMRLLDTTEQPYAPIESDSVFAFDFGQLLAPGESIPLPDTAAAAGPIQGQVVLFLVDQVVSENRPLKLELSADGAYGEIELDI